MALTGVMMMSALQLVPVAVMMALGMAVVLAIVAAIVNINLPPRWIAQFPMVFASISAPQ